MCVRFMKKGKSRRREGVGEGKGSDGKGEDGTP